MQTLLTLAAQNSAGAAILALLAAISSLLIRRPALTHLLWVLVLVKLVTPPIWLIPIQLGYDAPVVQAVNRTEPLGEIESHRVVLDSEIEPEIPLARVLPAIHSPVPRRLNLQSIVIGFCIFWPLGSIACAMIAIIRLRNSRLLCFAADVPREVRCRADRLAARLALRGAPRVSFIAAPVSPMLMGFPGRARLLIPEGLWNQLTEHQRDALLLHELAHFRRRDHWVRTLELLVTLLQWWNPLTWLARRQLRIAEELCCDAWVTWAMPGQADDYAAALVEAIDFASSRASLPLLASGVEEFKHLQRRLLMIRSRRGHRRMGWTALVACTAMIALPLAFTTAKQTAQPATNATGASLPATQPDPSPNPEIFLVFRGAAVEDQKLVIFMEDTRDNAKLRLHVGDTIRQTGGKIAGAAPDAAGTYVLDYTRRDGGAHAQAKLGHSLADAQSGPSPSAEDQIRTDRRSIPELKNSARDLTKAGKYREALELVDRIRAVDPNDEYAKGVRPLLQDRVELAAQKVSTRPAVASKRMRNSEPIIDRQLPDISFDGTGLSDVLQFMRDVSGGAVVVNWNTLGAVGVDRNSPVTLKLHNVTFGHGLDLILRSVNGDKAKLRAVERDGRFTVIPADAAAGEREAQALLERTLPEVAFDGVTLTDAVDALRDASTAQIFVNWKALELVGVDRDMPITLKLRNLKLSKCLDLLLAIAGGDKPKLGYLIEGRLIVISTTDDLAKNTINRVYDVRDLFAGLDERGKQARAAAIERFIVDTIDSQSWLANGGNIGSTRILQGQLIVTQTPENHRLVMALLGRLRAILDADLPPTTQKSFPLQERRLDSDRPDPSK